MTLGIPQVNDWAVSEEPAYTDLNTYIRDAFNFLTTPPSCRLLQNATQSLGSDTKIAFQINGEDNYSGWSGVSNTYTAQIPGWYSLTSRVCAAVTVGTGISLGPAYVLNGVSYGPTWLDLEEAGASPWVWEFYEETFLDMGDTVAVHIGGAAAGGGSPATSLAFPSTFEIVWLSE